MLYPVELQGQCNSASNTKGFQLASGTLGTTAQAKERFIEALRECPIVAIAARQAGLPRRTAYNHRKEDSEFRAAWDDALEEGMDLAEAEAWRRGVEGVDEPVYQGGQLVGYQRRYSDALLGRLLQAYRPEKFSEKHQHRVSDSNPLQEALAAIDGTTVGPPAERGADLPEPQGQVIDHIPPGLPEDGEGQGGETP